jgi:hypothetical protein
VPFGTHARWLRRKRVWWGPQPVSGSRGGGGGGLDDERRLRLRAGSRRAVLRTLAGDGARGLSQDGCSASLDSGKISVASG